MVQGGRRAVPIPMGWDASEGRLCGAVRLLYLQPIPEVARINRLGIGVFL